MEARSGGVGLDIGRRDDSDDEPTSSSSLKPIATTKTSTHVGEKKRTIDDEPTDLSSTPTPTHPPASTQNPSSQPKKSGFDFASTNPLVTPDEFAFFVYEQVKLSKASHSDNHERWGKAAYVGSYFISILLAPMILLYGTLVRNEPSFLLKIIKIALCALLALAVFSIIFPYLPLIPALFLKMGGFFWGVHGGILGTCGVILGKIASIACYMAGGIAKAIIWVWGAQLSVFSWLGTQTCNMLGFFGLSGLQTTFVVTTPTLPTTSNILGTLGFALFPEISKLVTLIKNRFAPPPPSEPAPTTDEPSNPATGPGGTSHAPAPRPSLTKTRSSSMSLEMHPMGPSSGMHSSASMTSSMAGSSAIAHDSLATSIAATRHDTALLPASLSGSSTVSPPTHPQPLPSTPASTSLLSTPTGVVIPAKRHSSVSPV